MSAVGPRPLTLADVQRLGWAGADCDRRWAIRPGLTGLAQLVDAGSSRSSLALDYAYAIRWRPLLDCQIIALSFAVNVFGKSRVSKWFRKFLQERAARRGQGQSNRGGIGVSRCAAP